jgi:hypothetical protein
MRKTVLFLALVVVLTSQSLFAQVPSYVPTNGLVGYWPFNGNANDESGNGNNGIVDGALLSTDRKDNVDSAYSFDGSNKITIPNKSSLNFGVNPTFTISVWINKSSQNNGGVISKALAYNGYIWNGWEYFNDDFSVGYPCLNNPFSINQNLWKNVIIQCENGIITIFVDGLFAIQYSCNQLLSNTISTSENMFFGVDRDGDYFFKGKIDDIGIWNRSLTTQEITNLYNSVSSSECLTMTINTGVLSTNPFTYTSSVSIYPNPANDQITIDCGNLANVSGWSIKITSLLGQEVFSQPMDTQQYVVPLNTWSGQGMYFVKIINAQNEVVNIKKIILH